MSRKDTAHVGLSSKLAFYHVSSLLRFTRSFSRMLLLDYHHQEDEQVASRGSISMKTAVLKQTPGSSGLRFEVQSTPTRGHHGVQKWYLKANHPVEAARWIQALNKSIEWSRREAERASVESEVASLLTPSTRGASGTFSRHSTQVAAALHSTPSSIAGDESPTLKEPSGDEHEGYRTDHEEESSAEGAAENPPHHLSFELHGNATLAQMELTAQMLGALQTAPGSTDAKSAMADSLNHVQAMLNEYVAMVRAREDWYREALRKERARQNVWEESLQAVVAEGELMERELRAKARRRSRLATDASGFVTASEMSSLPGTQPNTLRGRPPHLTLPPPTVTVESPQPTATPQTVSITQTSTDTITPGQVPSQTPTPTVSSMSARRTSVSRRPLSISPTTPPAQRPFSLIMSAPAGDEDDGEGDTDEEDEFFDAIEAGNLPNLVINDSLAGRVSMPLPPLLDKRQYEGYEHLRTRLGITSDDRPPMSLWAVLKNSIGKDLTKISFPVFFNEPTSMLQRMVSALVVVSCAYTHVLFVQAEDMEFSECCEPSLN